MKMARSPLPTRIMKTKRHRGHQIFQANAGLKADARVSGVLKHSDTACDCGKPEGGLGCRFLNAAPARNRPPSAARFVETASSTANGTDFRTAENSFWEYQRAPEGGTTVSRTRPAHTPRSQAYRKLLLKSVSLEHGAFFSRSPRPHPCGRSDWFRPARPCGFEQDRVLLRLLSLVLFGAHLL